MGDLIRYETGAFDPIFAHGSDTVIHAWRAMTRTAGSTVSFIDLCVMPIGSAIGVHTHAEDNEEMYVIVSGEGVVYLDGVERDVRAGDVVFNSAGGTHGLRNTGAQELRLVVIEVTRVSV